MKTKIITTLLLGAFIFGCNSPSSDKEPSELEVETTEESSEIDQDENDEIALNKGEKWKVNEEMTPFVKNAETIVNLYEKGDYKELAERLTEENKSLINSCTMDGKSHDELHKWLHPHLELVKELKKAENEEEANELVAELKTSFETYHTYFQ